MIGLHCLGGPGFSSCSVTVLSSFIVNNVYNINLRMVLRFTHMQSHMKTVSFLYKLLDRGSGILCMELTPFVYR